MLSEDLKSISAELGSLAGKVDENTWDFLRNMKANLEAIAGGVEDLEQGVIHG